MMSKGTFAEGCRKWFAVVFLVIGVVWAVGALKLFVDGSDLSYAHNKSKASKHPRFSEKSLKGRYAFTFQGVLLDSQSNTPVPVNAVGTIKGDGKGNIRSVERVISVGGEVLTQKATGTYSVNADGTGMAFTTVVTVFDDSQEVKSSKEDFSFVISDRARRLDFITARFEQFPPNMSSTGVLVPVSISGSAFRQR